MMPVNKLFAFLQILIAVATIVAVTVPMLLFNGIRLGLATSYKYLNDVVDDC